MNIRKCITITAIAGISLIWITGCKHTAIPPYNPGKTPQQYAELAVDHGKKTDTIITTATAVLTDPISSNNVGRASNIIDAAVSLKSTEQTLIDVSKEKEDNVARITVLTDENTQLKKDIESGSSKAYIWLRILAALLVAIGIGGMIYLRDMSMLAISAMGLALATSTFIFDFVEKYILWIGIGVVVALAICVYRAMVVPKTAAIKAVEVSEALKQRLKELGDQEFLNGFFGKGTIRGVVSHDPTTEKIITEARKNINKKSKPVVETPAPAPQVLLVKTPPPKRRKVKK